MPADRPSPRPAVTLRALAEAFTELRPPAEGSVSVAETMTGLTRLAVRGIPAARWASITVLRGTSFRTAAASDGRAEGADAIQYELGSGPCLDAISGGTVNRVDDVSADARWPEFGRRAGAEYGVAAMLSYFLPTATEEVTAGLNVYADTAHAFDDDATTLGMLLARHGAQAVAAALSREKAVNLERALESSREIGIALGVLMATHKVTRERAFELLRAASQVGHRKLREVAAAVAETGVLEPYPAGSSDGDAAALNGDS